MVEGEKNSIDLALELVHSLRLDYKESARQLSKLETMLVSLKKDGDK